MLPFVQKALKKAEDDAVKASQDHAEYWAHHFEKPPLQTIMVEDPSKNSVQSISPLGLPEYTVAELFKALDDKGVKVKMWNYTVEHGQFADGTVDFVIYPEAMGAFTNAMSDMQQGKGAFGPKKGHAPPPMPSFILDPEGFLGKHPASAKKDMSLTNKDHDWPAGDGSVAGGAPKW